MGMDFNIKPVGGSVAPPAAEPSQAAARSAVPTELPAHKSVTAANSTITADTQSDNDRLSRQVVIDREAAEIVYRVVDNRTALVIRQFPDEARLRARAYLRTLDDARQERLPRKTDICA